MKLYIIQWGYHSSNDGGSELDSIWTNKELALKYLHNEASGDHLSKKSDCYWTNGDKWIDMSEVNSDTEWMYGEPNEDR